MAILKKLKSKKNGTKKVFRTPFSFPSEEIIEPIEEQKKKAPKKRKRKIKNGRLLILPEEKRTHCVSVMLNTIESKKLSDEALKSGVSKSTYIRKLIQNQLGLDK